MAVARGVRGLRAPVLLRLAAGACAVGLATGAAGCTSSAEPSPLPEPSTSSSPAASPSVTPPTLPPEAEGTSPKAAKAFARHYFDVINYAARTGDTDGLRELGTKDCVSCEAIAGNIEKIYYAGGHIQSENWELRQARALKVSKGQAVLSLAAFLHPEVIVDADGTRDKKAGGKQPMTMFLRFAPSGPVVSSLDLVT